MLAATQGRAAEAEAALDVLCRTYWYPLYAYARRCGQPHADAQDLTQEFLGRLLEKRWLDAADREKGKPENLLLDKSGRLKVADFGIAKMLGGLPGTDLADAAAGADDATQSALGTPGYRAPEQKSDPGRIDSRADIYSLGVVIYEMLTGELPGRRLEPPSHKVRIDVRLDEVVLRALEQKPERRYQQVSEVKTMVETIASDQGGPGGARESKAEIRRTRNSAFPILWLMATLLLLSGAYAAWSIFSKGTPRALGSGPGSIQTTEAGREASREATRHEAGQERAMGTPQAPRLAQTSPPFVAYFNHGTVELLALSHPPLTNTACWHAGGRLLDTPFPEKSGSSDNWDKDNGTIVLAFRVHNESAHGISRPVFRTGEKSGIAPQSWTWQALDERCDNAIFFQDITGMELNQYSSMSLGFANSAWDMAITLGHGVKSMNGSQTSISPEGSWTVGYDATPAGGGDIMVNCVYSKKEAWETRLVCVDQEGKTTVVPERLAFIPGALATGTLFVSAAQFDRITEFRVQRRKYQWVEFQRVALKPGINTTVRMVDSVDTGNPAPKPESLVFDAVREVGLPMDDEGGSWFLNLDEGGIGFLDGYPRAGWKRNLKLSDGAVMLLDTNGVLTVAGAGVCLGSLPDSARAWENPEPSDLSIPGLPQPGLRVNVAGKSGVPPVTFAFRTAKGAWGLLQFTGFSDAPQSVIVRYKTLVGTVRKGGETGPLRAPEG